MLQNTPKKIGTSSQPVKRVGYPCTVCVGRSFNTEQGFNDHVKIVHNIFSCPKCDQIFAALDDLIRHKNDAGHSKPAFGGKVKSTFSPAFMLERADASSVQGPMLLHQQSSQARPSTGQHYELPTQTHTSVETRCQYTAQGHQQSPKQSHQTRSQVFQPHTQILSPPPQVQPQPHFFQSQSQAFQSQPYLSPSEYQVFPAPVPVLERQTQLARIQAEIQAEIQHAAAQGYQAQAQMFQSSVNDGRLRMEVCRARSEVYEIRHRIYHAPVQGHGPSTRGYQPQLQAHQSQMQVPPESASQDSGRASHLPEHHSRPPV
ncbi:hypothetical protein N7447_008546 [Penicillium robsamsonii]|uniref:uncharacterized protein n=1 Tax=Penicillium robsamsonii TaxID=1792511 RepID=UPI002547AA20|nr:uncharacterized protein N7447_008546 [Penicillium robsamsonii]KAJ5816313.1 hypothetical protein N7447_008546 [Penicillium robsamsonii]